MKKLKKPKPTFNSRLGKWGVDHEIIADGRVKRVKRYFVYSQKKQAESKARDIENEQNPKAPRAQKSDLTDSQIKEALWAFQELGKTPFQDNTLRNAITYFRDHYKESDQTEPLQTCISRYLAVKKGSVKKKPFNNIHQKLNHLKDFVGNVPIGNIDSMMLIAYFDEIEARASKATRENYMGLIGGFFDYASNASNKHRWITENPMEMVKWDYKQKYRRKIDTQNGETRRPPKILQLDESKHAIETALDHEQFLFLTILGLFCGLRPSEIADIAETGDYWRFINLDEGFVYIDENIGKEANWREVEILPNARLWLEFAQEHKLLLPKVTSYQIKKVYPAFRRQVFLTDDQREAFDKALTDNDTEILKRYRNFLNFECNDCFRHTYGTNLWYKTKSLNTVVAQMGNSIRVFIRHYKGALRPPTSYKGYWNLKPSDFGL